MGSLISYMRPRNVTEDDLLDVYKKFHITDATVKLLEDEGYTSVGLLKNIEAAGPEAVDYIPGLRGAQKMAVKAMLKSLTADDEANSSDSSQSMVEETPDEFPVIIEGLFPGEIMTIHVSKDEAIEDVKQKIKSKLKQSEDIDDIELHYHNQRLTTGTLSDYNVRHKVTLWISAVPHFSDQPVVNDTENSPDKELDDEFPVAIQSMSGEKGTIIVSASESIKSVRLKICNKLQMTRMHPDLTLLIFRGKQLVDEMTVSDYGVTRDCKLMVITSLRGD